MIPQYKRILYATDLSVGATKVFKHAIGIARAHDAKVNILHILPEVDAAVINYVATVMGAEKLAAAELGHKDQVVADLIAQLKQFAKDELEDFPADLERVDSIEVLPGHPTPVILAAADRYDADLIVIGNHGKGFLEYALLGKVATRIVKKSRRPVLIVPLTI